MGIDLRQQPTTDENVRYVTQLPGKAGRKMVVTGRQFDAVAGDTTHDDYTLAETRELQGAWMEVVNHQKGDYIELTVRGNLGEGEEELGKFAETIYVPASGKIDQIVSESTVSFPPTFKVRLSYHAVAGGETREVYAWLRMRH